MSLTVPSTSTTSVVSPGVATTPPEAPNAPVAGMVVELRQTETERQAIDVASASIEEMMARLAASQERLRNTSHSLSLAEANAINQEANQLKNKLVMGDVPECQARPTVTTEQIIRNLF